MKAGTPFTHFDVHAEEGGEYSTYKLPKRYAMGTYKAVVCYYFCWKFCLLLSQLLPVIMFLPLMVVVLSLIDLETVFSFP